MAFHQTHTHVLGSFKARGEPGFDIGSTDAIKAPQTLVLRQNDLPGIGSQYSDTRIHYTALNQTTHQKELTLLEGISGPC